MTPADDIRVRYGSSADAAAIAAFNRAMARETESRELPPGVIEAGVHGMLANPRFGFYAVAETGTPGAAVLAGCLMVTYEWSDWRNGLFWWIQSVYVDTPYRRRGVYTRLYDWVRGKAEESGGCCGFRLYVEKDNTRAQRTYETLGMRCCEYLMYEQPLTRGGSG